MRTGKPYDGAGAVSGGRYLRAGGGEATPRRPQQRWPHIPYNPAMTTPALRLLAATLLLFAAAPQAKKIYKYTDTNGVVHFTDRKPDTDQPVQETVVKVEQGKMVELRLEGHADQRQARVFNNYAGPAEVELSLGDASNIATEPPLPLTITLPARAERVLANLRQADTTQPARLELAIRAIPGSPGAHHEDAEYAWPLGKHDARIDQGFNGSFSHTDEQSRYAMDAATAEGTPVLAARDGVVMEVQDDYYGAGLDKEKFGGRANVVRVLHSDGSMAVYAHLRPESVVVQAGRHVYVGQQLGESGNTGFSTGPHLHFCIQLNAGMKLVSVPFRMRGPDGGALDLGAR